MSSMSLTDSRPSTSNATELAQRPEPTPLQASHSHNPFPDSTTTLRPEATAGLRKKKRHNHTGGRKKRSRKRSFALETKDGSGMPDSTRSRLAEAADNPARGTFYRVQGRNTSSTSIESETLLDHRDQSSMPHRKLSVMGQGSFRISHYDRPHYQNPVKSSDVVDYKPRTAHGSDDEPSNNVEDERAPLLPSRSKSPGTGLNYGAYSADHPIFSRRASNNLRRSSRSSTNSKRKNIHDKSNSVLPLHNEEYNVNYPPSMPGSPRLVCGRSMSLGDVLVLDNFVPSRELAGHISENQSEHAVDDGENISQRHELGFERRHSIALEAEEDVCFPIQGMSNEADEYMGHTQGPGYERENGSRRRRSKWPDLARLDEWSRYEREGRSDERRAKKITEPKLIGGRLRPIHKGWHRAEDDTPYRFTYFNEQFQSTIHSQTISELVQPGGSFRELFIPDRTELSDSSDSESEAETSRDDFDLHHVGGINGESRVSTRIISFDSGAPDLRRGETIFKPQSKPDMQACSPTMHIEKNSPPPLKTNAPEVKPEKPKRYGSRPTWWLDVLSPTESEMKVLSKCFGIHPLTAEDILMQEAREKVELFRNYYFVNYRSFEQDTNSVDFLEPVNMYVMVFREGVISFHFSQTPHPANVRRRIRQLKDYLILSSDWISYAIIDDITDVFAPLIQNIEDEVDDIDDAVLKLHSPLSDIRPNKNDEKGTEAGDGTSGGSDGDMLRRVGDCRKKVMGLYRLLGNKADVIKGFAKRCNEHWEVAPRSEIGLYLGDIQDHIVTMTANLSHYEKILARSHGNYLAQINIRMNERQEETADVLGKLTVLGTIVLPMNIITGLWGMNVWVPGQAAEGDLTWFFGLTAGLLVFGLICFFTAKLLYRIV